MVLLEEEEQGWVSLTGDRVTWLSGRWATREDAEVEYTGTTYWRCIQRTQEEEERPPRDAGKVAVTCGTTWLESDADFVGYYTPTPCSVLRYSPSHTGG